MMLFHSCADRCIVCICRCLLEESGLCRRITNATGCFVFGVIAITVFLLTLVNWSSFCNLCDCVSFCLSWTLDLLLVIYCLRSLMVPLSFYSCKMYMVAQKARPLAAVNQKCVKYFNSAFFSNNNNPFNGPLSTSTQVSWCQKKHSLNRSHTRLCGYYTTSLINGPQHLRCIFVRSDNLCL